MRILIASDLHNEFGGRVASLPPLPDPLDYDVVVLAGDIDSGTMGIAWAHDFFPKKPIIYVNGNHEYYHGNMGSIRANQKHVAAGLEGIYLLDPGTVVIDGIRFIGATMWTNLELRGYAPLSFQQVERSINDFRLIHDYESGAGERFTAEKMVKIHCDEVNFIWDTLSSAEEPCVVVTHFVPTQQAIHPRFEGSTLNPYFTTDCEWLMENPNCDLPLWIAGHTHDRYDIASPEYHNTRIVLNPRGYPAENPEPFEWKIVEV